MRANKTRAFYIETLILTFILLFVISILIRVFGAAGVQSLSAKRKTTAAMIAQNVVSEFQAESGELGKAESSLLEGGSDQGDTTGGNFTLSYGEDGLASEDGRYLAAVLIVPEERPVGRMLTMTVTVTYAGSEDILAAIDTAKYFPDSKSSYLLNGEVVSIEELSTEAETDENGDPVDAADLSGSVISPDGGYLEETEADETEAPESELARVTEASETEAVS